MGFKMQQFGHATLRRYMYCENFGTIFESSLNYQSINFSKSSNFSINKDTV